MRVNAEPDGARQCVPASGKDNTVCAVWRHLLHERTQSDSVAYMGWILGFILVATVEKGQSLSLVFAAAVFSLFARRWWHVPFLAIAAAAWEAFVLQDKGGYLLYILGGVLPALFWTSVFFILAISARHDFGRSYVKTFKHCVTCGERLPVSAWMCEACGSFQNKPKLPETPSRRLPALAASIVVATSLLVLILK